MSKVYYQHLRTELKRPTTIAYRYGDDSVYYALAECGPKDQFCRKIGRDIATGRLNKGHLSGHIGMVVPDDFKNHDEIRGLITAALLSP